MKTVFVSGCFDLLHAGHLQFFREAKALGDSLIVSFAADEVLWKHKHRKSSLPEEHKQALLEGLTIVDEVVVGRSESLGLDFEDDFLRIKPDILAVTTDDLYGAVKQTLCARTGTQYIVLPKTPPEFPPISTTRMRQEIAAPVQVPMRVDFAGGWLDVPHLSRPDGYIVNCAIQPMVSAFDWRYEQKAGLGGSAAWAILNGRPGVDAEIALGTGWQDPAIIEETGVCVWVSGQRPRLDIKQNIDWLKDRMALYWTGIHHDTPELLSVPRDYDRIAVAGGVAREAVIAKDLSRLAEAINLSHAVQLDEGMQALPDAEGMLATKYCGSGFGGYALYLFGDDHTRQSFIQATPSAFAIEPYARV